MEYAKGQATALAKRYQATCERARHDGLSDITEKLRVSADATAAVVTVPVGLAWEIVTNSHHLYAPYAQQVRAGSRAPAEPANDRRRTAVEALLYGTYGGQIVYGVLSGDGKGPISYGSVHLEMEEKTIAYRATILEDNSYFFVQRHDASPSQPLAEGHLAPWERRGQLAVCKLLPALHKETNEQEFGSLLCRSSGDRQTDSFLEVHIFGTFNYQAVGQVTISQPAAGLQRHVQRVENAIAEGLKEQLNLLGVPWIESR